MNRLILMLAFCGSVWADSFTTHQSLSDSGNVEAAVPQGSWFLEPNNDGWGINVTVQTSKNASSGYFVFGAFYAHKEDGSQVWYVTQGDYVPNDNPNAWRETPSSYGTTWGSEDATMGAFEGTLYETSGGMPLGSTWRPHNSTAAGSVRLVWVNPDKLLIYLNGSVVPSHSLIRSSFYSHEFIKGDADYLSENHYRMLGLHQYKGDDGKLKMEYIRSTMTFNKLNFADFFDADATEVSEFRTDLGGIDEDKQYYISNRSVGYMYGDFSQKGEEHVFDAVNAKFFDAELRYYVVLVYDKQERMLSGYWVQGREDLGPEKGLRVSDKLGFKFKGHLPPEDQGRLSLFPAKCHVERCGNEQNFTPTYTRRTVWHLFKIPDDNGLFYDRIPDVKEKDWGVYER